MTCYLYAQSGSTIGYLDKKGKYLYSTSGSVIGNFDSRREYMYKPNGSVYGYVSGSARKYLYEMSGSIIGYFHPTLAECDLETNFKLFHHVKGGQEVAMA